LVDEIMAGVAHESEAIGPVASNEFCEDDNAVEDQTEFKAIGEGRGRSM